MRLNTDTLPNDVDALKRKLAEYHSENCVLKEENLLLKQRLFGRKSEQLTEQERKQLYLFNEAEDEVSKETAETAQEEVVVATHTRAKKRGRKPLPEHLPRVVVEHDVAEHAKLCACGATKSRIGEETAERLDIVPARIQVIRDVRPKYACRACEGVEDAGPTVVIASPPLRT
jgi:transposase